MKVFLQKQKTNQKIMENNVSIRGLDRKKDLGLLAFSREYATKNACESLILELHNEHNGNLRCPHCGNIGKIYITSVGYKCGLNTCYKKFSIRSGTLFHESNFNLPLWFYYIYSQCISIRNLSSYQWAKNLEISQESSWLLGAKVRSLFKQDTSIKLSGTIEIDECFISKKLNAKKQFYYKSRKAPVLGFVERETKRYFIFALENRDHKTIIGLILEHIEKGSTIYTDEAPVYQCLNNLGYKHEVINHSEKEFSRGSVSTNLVENVWSKLKGGIRGSHIQVSIEHLQSYINEFVWRNENKHLSAWDKFEKLLWLAISSNPLRYNDVIKDVKKRQLGQPIVTREIKKVVKKVEKKVVKPKVKKIIKPKVKVKKVVKPKAKKVVKCKVIPLKLIPTVIELSRKEVHEILCELRNKKDNYLLNGASKDDINSIYKEIEKYKKHPSLRIKTAI